MAKKQNSSINLDIDIKMYSEENMFLSLIKEDEELAKNFKTFQKLMPFENLFNSDEIEDIIQKYKISSLPKTTYIDSSEWNKHYLNINGFDYHNHSFSNNNLMKKLSFSSNELNELIDGELSVKIVEKESRFNNETVSFVNTSEVVINKVDI